MASNDTRENQRFYDRLRWQRPLEFVPGLIADPRVDEVVLVCRRAGT